MIIAFPHRPPSKGGPGSFQVRIEAALREKGWEIVYPASNAEPDVIMVVGGTRKLGWLLKNKFKGVPVILRLDGINWLHRKTKVSWRQWITSECRNLLFQFIRSFVASHIIYQSNFVHQWWKKRGWPTKADYSIIYNGIDLEEFFPKNSEQQELSILAVEGNIDYSPYAIKLLNRLQDQIIKNAEFQSLVLYGEFQCDENRKKLDRKIEYRGRVDRSELPNVYQNAVYLSLDINAACPNTVIEAMASGIPVIGFDTGALKELVSPGAGKIVTFGSDPWELNYPGVEKLYEAARRVKNNWAAYSDCARKHAEQNFDIRDITTQYIKVIESQLSNKEERKNREHIHYFTNIAPHYREALWQLLAQNKELEVDFYFGTSANGIPQIDFTDEEWRRRSDKIHSLKNRRIRNTIFWQSGVLHRVLFLKMEKVLFLGDMNIVSTWLAAIILRIKGKQVFFWGHGFTGKESVVKKKLRILFNRLANQHFIYGKYAKNLMVSYGFSESDIHVIYNSLDYQFHKDHREKVLYNDPTRSLFKNPELPVLAFIGRLTQVKKLGLLIKAVDCLSKQGDDYNLLIIGEGPMRSNLEELATELLPSGSFYFYGSCYDEMEIGQLLANVDLCVSPGNVGLTAIHSLSFGTPVCSHNNIGNQMPEYEAIEPGYTGFLFNEDDLEDMTTKIREWFEESATQREQVREQCYSMIDKKYNPYHQISVFNRVFLKS